MKYALAVILLASPVLLWAGPPDVASVSGVWKITGDVHGRPVEMTCQLKENDRKLSGACTRSADDAAPHPIDGTVKGDKLQFQLQTAVGSRPITLIVSGKLNQDGSQIAGDLDVEPLGVAGKFEGEREANTASIAQSSTPAPSSTDTHPPTPASPPPSPSAQSATGTWKVDADFQGTAAQLICTLKQVDKTLSGTCTGEDGKANPVTGEVNEHAFTWRFDAQYEGEPITVTMTATLMPDGTMQGEASVTPLNADGTFTAKRQPAQPAPVPAAQAPSPAPEPTAGTPPAQ